MAYSSPFCTPDGTPLRVRVVESSTPWSEILLQEVRTTIRFDSSQRLTGRFGYTSTASYRTRVRSLSRLLGLTILVIILMWWGLDSGKHRIQIRYEVTHTSTQPKLDGLQFVDASHPYIHVDDPCHCHLYRS
jgi:hypothetical protein